MRNADTRAARDAGSIFVCYGPMDTGIVIVNWNGWGHTLECLEAVFRMKDFLGPVVVIDNDSSDGSAERLIAWADGRLCAVPEHRHFLIYQLVVPPVSKPIKYCVLDHSLVPVVGDSSLSRVQLHIVLAGANLGFAGGNNLGIELLLRFTDVERIWFINSDALPSKHAYREMTKAVCNEVEPFLAGSVLAEYWDPERIQTIGGRFWLYIGVSREMMAGKVIGDLSSLPTRVSVDYPAGAAMVVNRRFVTDCGRMREDYFLYYEEIDWVLRLGWPSKSFALPRSVVFHKGSSATGGSQDGAKRSLKSDYYMLRGRLLFARRVSRIAFWIALVMNICSILRRMCRSKSGLVTNAIRATRDGLRSEVKS